MNRQEGRILCARFFLILAAVGSLCISSNLVQAAGNSMFQCPGPNGHLIPRQWLCDGTNDCQDVQQSDERNCRRGATCNEFQFACRLNNTCIPQGWECDGTADCWDGSDEKRCAPRQCKSMEFLCANGHCVWSSFQCDGDNDCGDNSDERNCSGQFQCKEHQFQCDSQQCIPNNWECDGEIDCGDNSDEMDCGQIEYDCIFGMVNCTNGGCINANLVCDGSVDCLNDESDEEDCPALICRPDEFKCPDAEVGCIPRQWVCDEQNDCGDWSDEVNCVGRCTPDQYICITGGCVNQTQVCDGNEDCQDGSDEFRCAYPPPPVQCHSSQFPCLDGNNCIGVEFLCDNRTQCGDGSDEHENICAFSSYGVDECAVNNSGCEHSCHDTPYGFFCSCFHGYLLDPNDRKSCNDYNECGIPGMCSQLCYNTNGSYFCECVDGHRISSTHGGCKAEGPPAHLLFVNRVDIREVALNGSYSAKLIKHLHSAIAIDFHYQLGYIYWTDMSQDVINRARMDGSNITTIINTGLEGPGGMAVDWVAGKLYWSDAEKERIEVSDLEGKNRTVMFSAGLDRPRAIVLDPIMRLMFWTDWGIHPKIERASMDGKQRTIVHEKHLFWPNALTIDYPTHSLYWADSKLHVIESSHVDGSGRRLVIADVIRHPFAMTLFEDRLYWTDWETKSILSTNKGIGRNITEVLGDLIQPMDIHAVHPVRQPEAPNPCAVKNGGCRYLCLLSAESSQGYSCICPTGIQLAPNGRDCQPLNTFILFARITDIRRISLDVTQFVDVTLPFSNLSGALAVDWDSETDLIYWTDIVYDTINAAKIDGSDQHVLVSRNLKNPGGIAIEWVTRKLYWTDASTDRIEVSDLDGGNRSILVFGKLDKPRDVVVHPSAGFMFWTDWGRYPKVERAGLDGSNRTTIADTNLTFPNGLALDYEKQLIYWVDAGESVIEYADFDGNNREILLSSNVRHPFGLALHGDWLYWTDWLSQSVERVNKTTGLQRSTLANNLDRPMDVHVFNRNRPQQQVLNPCSSNNGGCSHLCLTRPSKRRKGSLDAVCACPTGHNLMGDKHNCDPIINNYLLFPTLSDARQISLDVPYLADTVLSIPRLTAASSLDVDIVRDEVYWTDRLDAKIYKAPMNGNGAAVEVINTNLVSPESLAIDWIAGNVYWVDSGTRRIEVATLNGTSRRVLFSTNVVLPTSIAVDLQSHTMFWTDAGQQSRNYLAKIEKATMDGSTRQTIVTYTSQGGAPRAITIDNPRGLAGRIYWTDSYFMTIESADIHGRDRRHILSLKTIDSASPFGIAVFGDHIYWTDMNLRTVSRARKDSGTAVSVVWEGGSDDQLAEIRVIKKIDLWNKDSFDHPCDSDQGCSDLCLPNQSIQKYTCACPTGIRLLNGATCRKFPRRYLLIAARTTIRRISMEMQSYNDVILVSGLHNAIAIDYLLTSAEDGMMFWTDVTKIYAANLNGTGKHEIVSSGIQNAEGLAVDWVAHNIYWTDTGRDRIEVARLDGSQRKVLVSRNLDEPRCLALHPHLGLMIWTDWGVRPKIERSNMDGSDRSSMVTTRIKWPNGITIDYTTRRVYWVDAYHNSLESININGNDRQLIISNDLHIQHPFGVAVHAGFVFWSDWRNRSIFRADVDEDVGGVNLFQIQGNINLPMAIVFVSSLAARPGELTYATRPGPCSFDNGGCNETHLCLALDSSRRRCACPDSNTTNCSETVGMPPPPPSTVPPPTTTTVNTRFNTIGTPPSTVTSSLPTGGQNLPPDINPPPVGGSSSGVTESPGTPTAIVLSTGILVTVIVVCLIVVVSIAAIILIAVIYVKRQHDKQEKRQRYEIVRQRSLQSLPLNKLNSSHATTVIQKRNNLIPQANNATVQKNKDGNVNIKEQNIFIEKPEVYEIPGPTRQKQHPSPPDSPPLKPPASPPPKSNKLHDKPPAVPPPPSDEGFSVKEAPPCLPPKGRPPVNSKSARSTQEHEKDHTPTSEKTQNTSPPLPNPLPLMDTKVQNVAPLENKIPEKSPNYDHLEIEPSRQGVHKEYDHLELKASSDAEELLNASSVSGTDSSSL